MKTPSISNRQNLVVTLKSIGFIMAFLLSTSATYAQSKQRTVTGVVKSIDGPLFGASILLKGTAIGVSSNENGEFTFPQKLQENDVLQVMYLGYENKEVKIRNNTTFVEPFLEDIPVIIVAALRTESTVSSIAATEN